MKLRALIIDDEPLAHEVICKYAADIPFLEISGQCFLATEALSFLQKNDIDLIFLDIQMPKLKGLDFLKILDKKPAVIITSAFREYALESYEQDVCDYLLKPFRFDRFLKAVNKALAIYENQSSTEIISETAESAKRIFVKVDKRLIQLALDEIVYLEAYGNYVKIWQAKTYHLTARTLSSFEAELPETQFCRIHKSLIVNKNHIDYLEGNMVVISGGKSLLIGKNYRQVFKAFLALK